MTNRITNSDLDRVLERFDRACRKLDLIPEGYELGLQNGSKVNGIAYSVFLIAVADENGDRPNWGQRRCIGDGSLGWSKAEAFDRLADRCRVLEDVAYHAETHRPLVKLVGVW
jgi:chromosome condensin MukBEF MukE localization factor